MLLDATGARRAILSVVPRFPSCENPLLMVSRPEELRGRTKQFAIRIVKLYRVLPMTQWLNLVTR